MQTQSFRIKVAKEPTAISKHLQGRQLKIVQQIS
jgi:hypothetical protein